MSTPFLAFPETCCWKTFQNHPKPKFKCVRILWFYKLWACLVAGIFSFKHVEQTTRELEKKAPWEWSIDLHSAANSGQQSKWWCLKRKEPPPNCKKELSSQPFWIYYLWHVFFWSWVVYLLKLFSHKTLQFGLLAIEIDRMSWLNCS